MSEAPRILILEDRAEDAELVLYELRRAGLATHTQVVDGRARFAAALDQPWDAILADYRLPDFSALAALEMLRERGLDIPVLVVTASLGDEAAAECIKRGASDYLLKDRLARLGTAVKQVIADRRLQSDKQRVEARLGDMQTRMRRFFDRTSTVPYAWSWREKRFVSMGPQAETLLGYPAADWLQREFRLNHIHPDDRERLRATVDQAAATGSDYELEYRMISRDGREVWIRDMAAFDIVSSDQYGHGFLFNITDSKRRDQQLIQAQKMEAVGQLTGGVAHDFNNILGVVIGTLDELLDILAENAPAKMIATSGMDAALRGADLIRRLLAFSRNQPLEPKLIDLNRTVRDTEPLVRRSLGERIPITLRIPDGLWPVFADRGQLENAILNLAINARDAMPGGGRLTITCTNATIDAAAAAAGELPVGDFVTVAVADTGTGIPPDILSRVFEPFFTTKEVGKGTGLGLSMVFGYAKQSGGTAKIYSEVGHGTEVRLYLPRASFVLADKELDVATSPAAAAGERILVVEDKPDVRRIAVRLIRSLGYEASEVGDPDAALDALAHGERFDLVFTDLVMPGAKSGVDLARELRQRFPEMPVLFTSGFSDPGMFGSDADALGVSIISKPYRKQELARAIRTALERVSATTN